MSRSIFAIIALSIFSAGSSVTSLIYLCTGSEPWLCKAVAAASGVVCALCLLAVGIIGERNESWRSSWNN